ncbi:ABC transporter ATP-binding protein [Variovorax sp. J22R133]|uniref:ABC transporter ATP-binding protein n=1 Tax=Variovorax brevis TaxID=3053503 RepID=UPI0025788AB2|nr:ABC transporter ATP-binding protein [Variovorax sp. J22R133]MDM0114079.1 ABC transporter ATP-binding protein [Variovorax sp. J22R133]
MVLSVDDVDAGYGQSQVLFGMHLQIAEGQTATLLGRNGAGKTTTVRAILGLTPARKGRIEFKGQRIDAWATDRIARLGVALVPEGRQIFPNLSVRENLVAFADNRNASREPWTLDRVYALFPRLKERVHHMGNQLSGGEQQMLAMGRALMTNPRLLILDEVTEGLSPLIREEIWTCLRQLRSQGQTTLVIDKYVERLLSLADHHTVVEKGRVVWAGSSAALEAEPEIWHRYVGV